MVNKVSPEAGVGPLEWVAREQGGPPDLVDVLENVDGAADRTSAVDEDGDGAVDGVHAANQLAPLADAEVLLDVAEGDTELPQRDPGTHPEAVRPEVDDRHLMIGVFGGSHDDGGGRWSDSWRRVPATDTEMCLGVCRRAVAQVEAAGRRRRPARCIYRRSLQDRGITADAAVGRQGLITTQLPTCPWKHGEDGGVTHEAIQKSFFFLSFFLRGRHAKENYYTSTALTAKCQQTYYLFFDDQVCKFDFSFSKYTRVFLTGKTVVGKLPQYQNFINSFTLGPV